MIASNVPKSGTKTNVAIAGTIYTDESSTGVAAGMAAR
jgi:hypothetical protein